MKLTSSQGQTFAVIGNTPSALLVVNVKANLPGMSTAKVSLGLFLLRIVVEQWHRVAIWIASLSLFAVSVMTAVLLWTQCIPAQAIFDIRVDGRCIFKITPFSIVLGCKRFTDNYLESHPLPLLTETQLGAPRSTFSSPDFRGSLSGPSR